MSTHSLTEIPIPLKAAITNVVMEREGRCEGREIRFRCPQADHEDRHPSARWNEEKATFRCDSCNRGGGAIELAKLLGIDSRTFLDRPTVKARQNGNVQRRIAATYDYHDADGKLLYQVVRYEPKDFRQRRPDGNGGYVSNLDGVRRVLYRLPDLIKADPYEPVYLTEGEKDADRLRSLGLTATTNPMGAGKWHDDYRRFLVGRRVVILPHNDDAGRKHAEQVAASLHDSVVSVKAVPLPDLEPKGDVSDWLDIGHSRDELEFLADITPDIPASGNGVHEPTPTNGANPSHLHAAPYTDLANAERLVTRHGEDLRYVPVWAKWLNYDGCRWQLDDTGQVIRWAKASIKSLYLEAAAADDDTSKAIAKHAKASQSASRIAAMIELAKSEPGIAITPDELDRDPWAFNTLSGTIDLKTGILRNHRRDDLITKLAPVSYDPAATAPTFMAFLHHTMGAAPEMIAFLARAVGYSLTGVTTERALFIPYGETATGKTTTLETIRALLGDYAMRTPTTTLMVKRGESIPNDIARLKGVRFVSASETEEGQRLAESLVKDLTGGDTISARFMRGEWFDFQPTFKIWVATNHKPIVRGTDSAIWDRLKLIPFEVQTPEAQRDPTLRDKLKTELPGILAWAVQGCLAWQRDGLRTPAKVTEATTAYRDEMDTLAGWMDDCCVLHLRAETKSSHLYESFKAWCEANGERPISNKAFSLRLKERGFEPVKGRAANLWPGIGLLDSNDGGSVEGVEGCGASFTITNSKKPLV